MNKIGLAQLLASKNPSLKTDLKRAEINVSPEQFVTQVLIQTVLFSLIFGFIAFMVLSKVEGTSPFLALPITLLLAFFFYSMFINSPKTKLKKIAAEIDREILFAGRFLLVKIHSGRPLLNALNDLTGSYGVSGKYFKKIVNDIDTGTPIEDAIENELNSTPSEKLQKILFQINNALKLGIDVSGPLSMILEEITKQQKLEITKYGKKLNSLVMFYMLVAIVVPSLGITMVVVVMGLIGMTVGTSTFFIAIAGLIFMQAVFMSLFRTIRPTVNL